MFRLVENWQGGGPPLARGVLRSESARRSDLVRRRIQEQSTTTFRKKTTIITAGGAEKETVSITGGSTSAIEIVRQGLKKRAVKPAGSSERVARFYMKD